MSSMGRKQFLLGKRASASKLDPWKPKIDEWLAEDRGLRMVLMGYVDNATGRFYNRRHCPEALETQDLHRPLPKSVVVKIRRKNPKYDLPPSHPWRHQIFGNGQPL